MSSHVRDKHQYQTDLCNKEFPRQFLYASGIVQVPLANNDVRDYGGVGGLRCNRLSQYCAFLRLLNVYQIHACLL